MGRIYGIGDNPTYGFYVALESWTPASVSESYWTAEGDANTVLTVTNFGNQTDKIGVEITYNGGQFTMPAIELQSLGTTTISIRDWVGKLPPGVSYGGWRISGQSMLTSKILVKEHVVSEAQQMSTPFYDDDTYMANYALECDNSCSVLYGGTDYIYTIIYYSDGSSIYDYPDTASCSGATNTICVSDTSVVNVESFGVWDSTDSVYADTVAGDAQGSTTMTAWSPNGDCDQYGSQCSISSDAVPVYAQKPGGVKYVNSISNTAATASWCSGVGASGTGWQRYVNLQLVDQGTPPTRIPVAGITMADTITPGGTNAFGMTTVTGSYPTNNLGQWPDQYFLCSTSCPTVGQTQASQTWTAGRSPLVSANNIVYQCTSITIDGQ
jgi:hypothetical protein